MMLSPAFMAPLAASGKRLDAGIPGVYLKDSSVNVKNLAPELLRALVTMRDVLSALGAGPLVVTSGNDGFHVPGSRHYVNDAVDVRSLHIPSRAQRERVGKTMALAIGARLKLSGGPNVGTDPGLMLWVEERPDSVPHFHLQIFRSRGQAIAGQATDARRGTAPSKSGSGAVVLVGVLAGIGLAYALSRPKS